MDRFELLKDQNDKDHKEIKDDLKFIRNIIAPQVASNKTAIVIILGIISAGGFFKAIGAW